MSIAFKKEKQLALQIPYPDNSEDPFLKELRLRHRIDSLLKPELSDFQNILQVQNWVYSVMQPKDEIMPVEKDALQILELAKNGQSFNWTDFNRVNFACLEALGFTFRTLWLTADDSETTAKGKKHILMEVYLKDCDKWFFIDPVYNIMVCKDKLPLNAVEFQQALINEEELEVLNPWERISCEDYLEWIGAYLFYFTTSLNKGSISIWDRIVGKKKKLTLIPVGEELPAYFKKLKRLRTNLVTNSLADFYPALIRN